MCSSDDEAFGILVTLYRVKHTGQTVIFVQTQADAPLLAERLNKESLRAEFVSAQLSNEERQRIVSDFRDGKIKVLIATDLLARGFNVPETFLVINWTPPMIGRNSVRGEHVNETIYYHRAGRAGRFGRTGLCFTFVRSQKDFDSLRKCCGGFRIDLKVITKDRLNELPDEQIVETDPVPQEGVPPELPQQEVVPPEVAAEPPATTEEPPQ
jgi:ATP-dependent RNA helicase DDX19/DBP5